MLFSVGVTCTSVTFRANTRSYTWPIARCASPCMPRPQAMTLSIRPRAMACSGPKKLSRSAAGASQGQQVGGTQACRQGRLPPPSQGQPKAAHQLPSAEQLFRSSPACPPLPCRCPMPPQHPSRCPAGGAAPSAAATHPRVAHPRAAQLQPAAPAARRASSPPTQQPAAPAGGATMCHHVPPPTALHLHSLHGQAGGLRQKAVHDPHVAVELGGGDVALVCAAGHVGWRGW